MVSYGLLEQESIQCSKNIDQNFVNFINPATFFTGK